MSHDPLDGIDVAPVLPEARQIVHRAAETYLRHTAPWFIGLMLYGSALKGGYLPGGSGIDLQLYLKDAAFGPDGQLPLYMGMAIHRELAPIDVTPFSYIQCYPLKTSLEGREDWVGPIPGAFHLVAGRLPIPAATADQLRDQAHRRLSDPRPVHTSVANELLGHGAGNLARRVRLLLTEVWPGLYQVLTCYTDDPLAAWRLPKDRAIELLPAEDLPGREIRRVYAAAHTYYAGNQSVPQGLQVLLDAVAFLQAAATWYRR